MALRFFRKSYLWWVGGVLLLLALGLIYALVTFSVWQLCWDGRELGAVDRLVTNSSSPELSVCFRGYSWSAVSVEVDGAHFDLSPHIWSRTARIKLPALADGEHTLHLLKGDGPLEGRVWHIKIDTLPPQAALIHPREDFLLSKKTVTLIGQSEPGCSVRVRALPLSGAEKSDGASGASPAASAADKTSGEAPSVQASASEIEGVSDADGKFVMSVPLNEGVNILHWQVSDEAGNAVSGERRVVCDVVPPLIEMSLVQPQSEIMASPQKPYVVFSANSLELVCKVQKDVYLPEMLHSHPSEAAAAPSVTESGEYGAAGQETNGSVYPPETQPENWLAELPLTMQLSRDGNALNLAERAEQEDENLQSEQSGSLLKVAFRVKFSDLYEGIHNISLRVTDKAGNSSRRDINFVVDSTEKLGQHILGMGARGADVSELQQRLQKQGFLHEPFVKGKVDGPTFEAVKAFQTYLGVYPDGLAGPQVIASLGTRLYVNLSRFEVVLVNEQGGTRYYGICTGVKDHPTPTGYYYIYELEKDPTWLPPNSEWAKDAKQAPPGPDNPLGTRWIGLSIGSVGFHGTPFPWTVGTQASHGCMRMRQEDVEDLFERVSIGTPVWIFAGDEDNAMLHKYWP